MRRNALAVAVALALGLAAVACEDATSGQEIFVATLSGSSEVPANGSGGNGTAQVVIDGDRVHYSVQIDDIQSVFASHIHTAPAGTNGPVRVTFFNTPQSSAISISDTHILAEGTFTASNVSVISFQDLLNAIRSGGAYVNVHTTRFPGGEIRGQLQRVQ